MEKDNNKTESLLRSALSKEVKYIIAIVGFVATVGVPFYTIKQDVALIKQNHYFHIEQLSKEMNTNIEAIASLKEEQKLLMSVIIANQTKLEMLMSER